jgi:hypothetical protein
MSRDGVAAAGTAPAVGSSTSGAGALACAWLLLPAWGSRLPLPGGGLRFHSGSDPLPSSRNEALGNQDPPPPSSRNEALGGSSILMCTHAQWRWVPGYPVELPGHWLGGEPFMSKNLSSNFESVGWSAMKYSGVTRTCNNNQKSKVINLRGSRAHAVGQARMVCVSCLTLPFPLPKYQILPPGKP